MNSKFKIRQNVWFDYSCLYPFSNLPADWKSGKILDKEKTRKGKWIYRVIWYDEMEHLTKEIILAENEIFEQKEDKQNECK